MKTDDALIEKIAEVVDKKIAARLEPVNNKFKTLDNRLEAIEKRQKRQGKDISYIRKTLDVVIDHFDRRDIKLQKRVSRVEDKLGLSVLQ